MADPFANALFCDNVGITYTDLHCCYIDNQNSSICRTIFNPREPIFLKGCNNSSCIEQCQDPQILYRSASQDDAAAGNVQVPMHRFRTCVNVPTMAHFARQDVLSDEIGSLVGAHVPFDTPDPILKKITSTVTECLTQTCKASRNQGACSGPCSAVNMLINPTTPDINGVNKCLNKLCTGNYGSLPYADADVVGIGVFSSYILQCLLLLFLWLGLFFFERYNCSHPSNVPESTREKPTKLTLPRRETPQAIPTPSGATFNTRAEEATHQSLLETCLVQFHVSQCYFSATIQVASLAYGIFSTDMLIAFLLLPLAINGVVPVVFGYLLLFRYGHDSMDVTLLTAVCWLLSSVVYWILYAHIIPVRARFNSDDRRFVAYQQLAQKLSALDSCGGYSALAVCPNNFKIGREEVLSADQKLHYLTPIMWAFSTIYLFLVLAAKVINWHREWRRRTRRRQGSQKEEENTPANSPPGEGPSHGPTNTADSPLLAEAQISIDDEIARSQQGKSHTANSTATLRSQKNLPIPFLRSDRSIHVVWAFTVMFFLVGILVQFSLLSISSSLKMMNGNDWGFGQIVAVVVWVPPLLQYFYDEIHKSLAGRLKARFGLRDEAK